MAQTAYVELPAGIEELFLKALKSGDRFTFGKIIRNDTLLSKRRKTGVSARSMLPQLSALWSAFTDGERAAWASAAGYSNLKGWQLFVQDQIIRIKNEIAGSASPVAEHQSWVGEIKLSGDASEIKLIQTHPHTYWILKKVYKKKGMYEPVQIQESMGLPLEIGISYKSDLVSSGASPSAKFYADVVHSYQGVDEHAILEIPFDLQSDWQIETATLLTARGILIGYNLYIHLHDVQGSLWFDNVKSVHGGTNYARDPRCEQIETTFTKAFFQIPKNWAALILPDGAEYDSVYLT